MRFRLRQRVRLNSLSSCTSILINKQMQLSLTEHLSLSILHGIIYLDRREGVDIDLACIPSCFICIYIHTFISLTPVVS